MMGAVMRWMLVFAVIGIMLTVGMSVMNEFQQSFEERGEIEATEPAPVAFNPGVALVVLLIGGLIMFALTGLPQPTGSGNGLDTPERAIEREKARYVEGDITLEQFEDRVYQKIPVEDQ